MKTLYQQAKDFLREQYVQNREIVKSSDFHRAYVDEKIRHSLQVSGAGNGILRHVAYFQNRSAEFMDICRSAIVLHDIFRFTEVKRWFLTGEKSDHGVEGAALLEQTPPFQDKRITLSIKHHGHMIEEFYKDPAFQNLADPALQKDIEHIHFAVRDADKIANWQILSNEFETVRLVWLPHAQDTSAAQGQITPEAWQSFIDGQLVPHQFKNTDADILLSVLSWLFDINYTYSIIYSRRLNLFNKFFKLFEMIGVEQEKCEQIKNTVRTYVANRFKMDI